MRSDRPGAGRLSSMLLHQKKEFESPDRRPRTAIGFAGSEAPRATSSRALSRTTTFQAVPQRTLLPSAVPPSRPPQRPHQQDQFNLVHRRDSGRLSWRVIRDLMVILSANWGVPKPRTLRAPDFGDWTQRRRDRVLLPVVTSAISPGSFGQNPTCWLLPPLSIVDFRAILLVTHAISSSAPHSIVENVVFSPIPAGYKWSTS